MFRLLSQINHQINSSLISSLNSSLKYLSLGILVFWTKKHISYTEKCPNFYYVFLYDYDYKIKYEKSKKSGKYRTIYSPYGEEFLCIK